MIEKSERKSLLRIRIVSRKNAIGPGLILVSLSRARGTGGGLTNGCVVQGRFMDAQNLRYTKIPIFV